VLNLAVLGVKFTADIGAGGNGGGGHTPATRGLAMAVVITGATGVTLVGTYMTEGTAADIFG